MGGWIIFIIFIYIVYKSIAAQKEIRKHKPWWCKGHIKGYSKIGKNGKIIDVKPYYRRRLK